MDFTFANLITLGAGVLVFISAAWCAWVSKELNIKKSKIEYNKNKVERLESILSQALDNLDILNDFKENLNNQPIEEKQKLLTSSMLNKYGNELNKCLAKIQHYISIKQYEGLKSNLHTFIAHRSIIYRRACDTSNELDNNEIESYINEANLVGKKIQDVIEILLRDLEEELQELLTVKNFWNPEDWFKQYN